MKTAIKLTALAVITVLVALSCVDPVSLTDRDYGDRNDSYRAEYTNNLHSENFTPRFYGPTGTLNQFVYESSPSTVADSDRESKISFPSDKIDVLKADNASIEAELKKFLTFSQYSNPATDPKTYTPSTIGAAVNYTFVRREGNDIIIKVDVPNISAIVAKIDASKYTVYGQPVDFNGDGVVDSYDDRYTQITIAGATTAVTGYTPYFSRPEATIDITLTGPAGGPFIKTLATPIYWTIFNFYTSGADYAYQRTVLNEIAGKIIIEKYDQATNTWSPDSGKVAVFEGTATPPTGSGLTAFDQIYGSITPSTDRIPGIYRIKATGVANLKTSGNYGGSGKPAKIIINNRPLYNTQYSNPVSYYSSAWQWETENPIQLVKVRYDSKKTNVVLDVFFKSIVDTTTTPSSSVWLKEIGLDEFKKNFKLVYKADGGIVSEGDIFNNSFEPGSIVEVPIAGIAYSASKYFDTTNTKTNCITITLDKSYKIDGNRGISFLINTGFKYASDGIVFGNPRTTNSYFNGSYFWRSYGGSVEYWDSGTPDTEVSHWEWLAVDDDSRTYDTDPNSDTYLDNPDYYWGKVIDEIIPGIPPHLAVGDSLLKL